MLETFELLEKSLGVAVKVMLDIAHDRKLNIVGSPVVKRKEFDWRKDETGYYFNGDCIKLQVEDIGDRRRSYGEHDSILVKELRLFWDGLLMITVMYPPYYVRESVTFKFDRDKKDFVLLKK